MNLSQIAKRVIFGFTFSLCCSHDPHFDKALQGIENLQKLASSDLEDTASLGGGSELEDEGEDILVAGGLEDALEVHALCL